MPVSPISRGEAKPMQGKAISMFLRSTVARMGVLPAGRAAKASLRGCSDPACLKVRATQGWFPPILPRRGMVAVIPKPFQRFRVRRHLAIGNLFFGRAWFIRLYGPRRRATAASPLAFRSRTPRPQFQMCASPRHRSRTVSARPVVSGAVDRATCARWTSRRTAVNFRG